MRASTVVQFCEWYSRQPKTVKVSIVIAGTTIGAVGGIFAAPAAGAIVSGLGFGVAGGTLSGAAASSAGLAALGGGSLASGGMGMLGGTCAVASATGASAALSTAAISKKVTKNGKPLFSSYSTNVLQHLNYHRVLIFLSKFSEDIIEGH